MRYPTRAYQSDSTVVEDSAHSPGPSRHNVKSTSTPSAPLDWSNHTRMEPCSVFPVFLRRRFDGAWLQPTTSTISASPSCTCFSTRGESACDKLCPKKS